MMIRSMPPASAHLALKPVPAPPPMIGRPAATWARSRVRHSSRVNMATSPVRRTVRCCGRSLGPPADQLQQGHRQETQSADDPPQAPAYLPGQIAPLAAAEHRSRKDVAEGDQQPGRSQPDRYRPQQNPLTQPHRAPSLTRLLPEPSREYHTTYLAPRPAVASGGPLMPVL